MINHQTVWAMGSHRSSLKYFPVTSQILFGPL
jgi:hypothetical protein